MTHQTVSLISRAPSGRPLPVISGTGAHEKPMIDFGRPLPAHFSDFYGLPVPVPAGTGRAGLPTGISHGPLLCCTAFH